MINSIYNRVKQLVSACRPVLQFFADLAKRYFLFCIRIEIYIVSYVFYTYFGVAFYLLSVVIFIGDPGTDDLSLFYVFCILFYYVTSLLVIHLFLLFRFPPTKRLIESHFDPAFIKKMVGNPLKQAATVIAGATVAAFGFSGIEKDMDSLASDRSYNNQMDYALRFEEKYPGYVVSDKESKFLTTAQHGYINHKFESTFDKASAALNQSIRVGAVADSISGLGSWLGLTKGK